LSFGALAQVNIHIDEKVNEELRMKNGSIDTTKISGYRIQIAFSSQQSVVKAAQSKFRERFPELYSRTYINYQQPYWKLRVDDFYREIDAQEMLIKIRKYFPDAFIVKDNINSPRLD
jgi:hypothetical protein